MKIVFLLPPSEGKNAGGEHVEEKIHFVFEKPHEIAINATEKDLKCIGNRYQEGIMLNKQNLSPLLTKEGVRGRSAISRYSGVMYNAIDYYGMSKKGQSFFEEHFLIFSGMYGKLKPNDIIGNYKLPIETKGLLKFWGDSITESLNNMDIDYIVNLLPLSYMKMLNFKILKPQLININFLTEKDGKIVKISHGVKKIKGEWIKNICENKSSAIPLLTKEGLGEVFGGEAVENNEKIDINILY